MSTEVLSIRIKKELKEKAEKLGINIREVVEKALEEEIKRREEEKIREVAKEIIENMKDVTVNEWIKIVRENRSER
ncbi:type II toxin-antitoxin system CcdA family antitoxin [Sulfurisphaera javensis]